MSEPRGVEQKLQAADQGPESLPWLEELPPKQIVAELDRYIVGQEAAKKAVAIAIRNRWRRAQAPEDLAVRTTLKNSKINFSCIYINSCIL